jgi:hypothetical protein
LEKQTTCAQNEGVPMNTFPKPDLKALSTRDLVLIYEAYDRAADAIGSVNNRIVFGDASEEVIMSARHLFGAECGRVLDELATRSLNVAPSDMWQLEALSLLVRVGWITSAVKEAIEALPLDQVA